jgi:hypothetical protein
MTSVLSFGALLTVPGCLIPEASESTPPARTPPFIIYDGMSPEPHRVKPLVQNQAEALSISFEVLSEDAGEPLVGALSYDFNAGGAQLKDQDYPPSTLAEPRGITMTLHVRNLIPVGCHVLTLLLMHRSSYDSGAEKPHDNAWDDVAMVNWVVSVSSPDVEVDPRLLDCPLPGDTGVANPSSQ